ncbi:MAG TPA: hypothetical protein VNM38_04685 [Solirubrobacterales bacterium]|nr:hypothetical protein [Solirubrobacterales bacterium]
MTYTFGVLRVLLLALPFVAVALVTVLLNQIDASPDAGFAALCLISVFTGIGIGLYVSRQDKARSSGPSRRAACAGR